MITSILKMCKSGFIIEKVPGVVMQSTLALYIAYWGLFYQCSGIRTACIGNIELRTNDKNKNIFINIVKTYLVQWTGLMLCYVNLQKMITSNMKTCEQWFPKIKSILVLSCRAHWLCISLPVLTMQWDKNSLCWKHRINNL